MRKILTVEGTNIRAISHAPSPRFDPLTASRAELEENGFPPVPEDPRLLEQFAREWSKLKNKFHYIEPKLRVMKNGATRRLGRRPLTGAPLTPSRNWCGAVVFASPGESFQSVIGSWVVPSVVAPPDAQGPNATYGCGIWVGIDGYDNSSPDVFQAGVQALGDQSTGSPPSFSPFWEWTVESPDGTPHGTSVTITNFPVSPGDNMLVMICTAGAGSTKGGLFWVNATTGGMVNVAYSPLGGLDAPYGTKLVGNCAEWIVEAPAFPDEILPLADFGSITFLDCQAVATNKAIVDGGTGDPLNMHGAMGTSEIIAVGSILGPTTIGCQRLSGGV